MKRFIILILFAYIFLMFSNAFGTLRPVSEPEISTATSWDVQSSGMLWVGYDLNGNGSTNYYTVRIVLDAYYSKDSFQEIKDNNPMCPVFFIDYDLDRYYYITAPKPIYYAFDLDEDGHWDLMFKDVMEDGVNGNEQFYDSPSKKYKKEAITELPLS